jgi:hypothetical protein
MQKFLFIILFLSQFQLAFSGLEIEFFSPYTPKPMILKADPEQAQVRLIFLRSLGGYSSSKDFSSPYFWDAGLGGDGPFFNITDNKKDFISANVRGFFKTRFNFLSKSFDMINSDFYGGLSLLFKMSRDLLNDFEIYFYHQSSHLGDDFMVKNIKPYINYSREVLRLLHYFSIYDICNVAYGSYYVVRKDPLYPAGRFILQANINLNAYFNNYNIFYNTDIKSKQENNWSPNLNFQLGIQFPKISYENALLAFIQSIVIEYYNGYSYMGQFSDKKEQYLSIGIIATL